MKNPFYKSFVKDNLVVIAGHIVINLKGLLLLPLIVKSVGVTIYGGFTLIASILSVIFGLSSFGAGFRFRRHVPSAQTREDYRTLFFPQFYFQLFSILCFSLFFLFFNEELNRILFKGEVIYNPLIAPFYLVSYYLYSQGCDYFRYTSRIKLMTVANLVFPILHLFFVFCFLLLFQIINVDQLLWAHTIAAFVTAAPCLFFAFREMKFGFLFYGEVRELIRDIKLGFPIVLSFVVDFILIGADRYFIAYFLSVTAVGFYNPGYILGSLIIFIPKAMGTALPQLLSRAVDSDSELEAKKMLNYAVKIFLVLAIPYIFGCIALGKMILSILANPQISEKAYWVAPIVSMGTIFYGLNLFIANALFVRVKTYAVFKANLMSAIFNLVANLVFIYWFRSIIVAAITTFFSYAFAFIFLKKALWAEQWQVDLPLKTVWKCLLASLIMMILLIGMQSFEFGSDLTLMLSCQLVSGFFIYFVCIFFLGVFTPKELQFAKKLIDR